jgi:hypothetical protein
LRADDRALRAGVGEQDCLKGFVEDGVDGDKALPW